MSYKLLPKQSRRSDRCGKRDRRRDGMARLIRGDWCRTESDKEEQACDDGVDALTDQIVT